jgi:hypothetical protein
MRDGSIAPKAVTPICSGRFQPAIRMCPTPRNVQTGYRAAGKDLFGVRKPIVFRDRATGDILAGTVIGERGK